MPLFLDNDNNNDNDKVFYSIHLYLIQILMLLHIKIRYWVRRQILRQKYVAGTYCHPIIIIYSVQSY